jgi:hypothetical protein
MSTKQLLLAAAITIALLAGMLIGRQHRPRTGVLDHVKATDVPREKWAETLRNYRQ